jgi:hypothetical protein
MYHTSPSFWKFYYKLPKEIQEQADKNFDLLKINPSHPSLHFKRIGKYWSVRASLEYRALGTDVDDGILWFWIGEHSEYERLIYHKRKRLTRH